MGKPCVFFDRDGIVNTAPPKEEYYVLSVERFFIEPAFVEALAVVRDKGWEAVIVTNQKCVHRGLITRDGVEAIHKHLVDNLAERGLSLLGIYYCPHDDGHPDRKPAPGMLLRAAEEHDLDLAASWMVGDSERDMLAGQAAGCHTKVLVKASPEESVADAYLKEMSELPGYLRKHLPPAN